MQSSLTQCNKHLLWRMVLKLLCRSAAPAGKTCAQLQASPSAALLSI